VRDLTGLRVGKLVALRPTRLGRAEKWYWLCQCDCGKTVERLGYLLTRGKKEGRPASCGCTHHLKTHGLLSKGTPRANLHLNNIWCAMHQRCQNPTNKDYRNYGARGITICDEWSDFAVFFAWAWDSGYAVGLTIERVDVNGHYCPENCTWIPNAQQALNLRRTLLFTFQGRTMGIRAWSEASGIAYYALRNRLSNLGWDVERALTTPVAGRRA
jgi:hypothetical protein